MVKIIRNTRKFFLFLFFFETKFSFNKFYFFYFCFIFLLVHFVQFYSFFFFFLYFSFLFLSLRERKKLRFFHLISFFETKQNKIKTTRLRADIAPKTNQVGQELTYACAKHRILRSTTPTGNLFLLIGQFLH